jgi:hypothetical protein
MATKKQKDVSGTKPEGTAATEAAPAAKKLPLRTLRVDDCSASIWARDYLVRGTMRTFLSVTLERAYRDRNGVYKYTHSFDADSLGKLVTLCQQASEVIHTIQQQAESSGDNKQQEVA